MGCRAPVASSAFKEKALIAAAPSAVLSKK
jgi:hypothetical protein